MQRVDQMDMLNVDVLPPPGHDGDDEGGEGHPLLRLHVSSSSLQDGSDDGAALAEHSASDYDASQPPTQPHSHRAGARRRRKIGKGLQLMLLRKYVQCAKQFSRLPDRLTTEQLLEQGYDSSSFVIAAVRWPDRGVAVLLSVKGEEIFAE
jgi:hypothetical protein